MRRKKEATFVPQLLFYEIPCDRSQLLSAQIIFTVQFHITVAKINLLLSKWKELNPASSSLFYTTNSPSCSTFQNILMRTQQGDKPVQLHNVLNCIYFTLPGLSLYHLSKLSQFPMGSETYR